MKRLIQFVIAVATGVTLVGCGAMTKEIARMGHSERTGVFTEDPSEGTAPAGFVDLIIKASIKTPLEGYYILESKDSVHGKPGYPFLLNIDGQAVLWRVNGQKETVPLYDQKGKTSRDPEAGTGMKYHLEKKVRLAVGPHSVFFGVPGEPYATDIRLTLKEGGSPVLEFKPRYRYKKIPTRIPTFLSGSRSYETLLNGQSVRRE